jgi:hypothetical protein
LDTFFNDTGQSYIHPRSIYDPVHQRWIIVAVRNATPHAVALAVSINSSPFAWHFNLLEGLLSGDIYGCPMLGINRHLIVVSLNRCYKDVTFGYISNTRIFAWDKIATYSGSFFLVSFQDNIDTSIQYPYYDCSTLSMYPMNDPDESSPVFFLADSRMASGTPGIAISTLTYNPPNVFLCWVQMILQLLWHLNLE